MDGLDIFAAGEILCIECENTSDSMHMHRRDKTRIVHLHVKDAIVDQQARPLLMNGGAVREQTKRGFHITGAHIGCSRGEAISVPILRTCGYIPKFAKILGGITG